MLLRIFEKENMTKKEKANLEYKDKDLRNIMEVLKK